MFGTGTPAPVTGDAARLRVAAGDFEETAARLQDVARQLVTIADSNESVGQSADALRADATEAAAGVRAAVPRYEATAAAVQEFALVLEEVQSEAQAAIVEIERLEQEQAGLEAQQQGLDGELSRARMSGNAEMMQELSPQLTQMAQLVDARQGELAVAWERYRAAVDRKEVAGAAAAAAIQPVLEALNDGFFDRVGGFFSDVGEAIADGAQWVGKWVSTVLEQVILYLALVSALAVAVVVVIAMLAVAQFADFLAVTVTGEPVVLGVVTGDEALDAFIKVFMGVLPVVATFLTATLAIERMKPTPEMKFVGTRSITGTPPYLRVFRNAGAVDDIGLSSKTHIEVVRVGEDFNGTPVWRVIVPSTMDWEFTGDRAAANDLGSNASLMLDPLGSAAYERMIMQTMTKAGIGPEDHVMMNGWSQGGIVAGKMASDPDCPFNVDAIVVAGAPIDHMNIPDTVSVVSIQHAGDPVHRLDGQAPAPPSDNWAAIRTNPSDTGSGSDYTSPLDIDASQHDADRYAETARALETGKLVKEGFVSLGSQEAFVAVKDAQEMYFSHDESALVYEGVEEY